MSFALLIGRALHPLFGARRSPLCTTLEPRRIVVLKSCCIGDVLFATAALGALRRAYPRAWITFAVGEWARAAIAGNPDCDGLLDCGRVAAGATYTTREYWRLVRRLRAGRFDLAVVLERSACFAVLPALAGIPRRAGLDSDGRGFSLTHPVPVPGPVRGPARFPRHEAELYLDVVRALGIPAEDAQLRFVPSEADRRWAIAALSRFDGPPIALHPGGAANPGMVLAAKRWPPERYTTIAHRLLERGHRIVLVGGPGDRDGSVRVRSLLGDRARDVVDLTGLTTLGRLGAVLERCRLYVGGDTGPMHLAVAVGTRVVAIFGPSTPEMYGPFSSKSEVLYRPTECSPCFLRGTWKSDCPDYRCIKNVQSDHVLDGIERMLSRPPAPPIRGQE